MVAFDQAVAQGLGLTIGLPPEEGEAMVFASKGLRDPAYRARERYYSVNELNEASHPYRLLFAGFEDALRIETL